VNKKNYSKVVRLSGIYDVIVTFPFAFPILAAWNIGLISELHIQFGFSGTVPEFSPLHLFFVNLMGSLVLVWSCLRIYKPEPLFGLFDSFARFLFSFNMLYYLLAFDATGILWVLFVPELTWGLVQFYGYFLQKKH
jgi:hypothetical protein